MLQPKSLLAIDSTGKTTGKSFCHRVCDQYRWCTPIYMPGAAFEELVDAVTRSPMQHDKLCIVSMGNKVVEMNWDFYMQIRETKVWPAALRLAERITKNAVKEHLILFGGDVALWEGAEWPTEYPFIQQDILFMLSHLGLSAGTGMESENGDFGRFHGKLTSAGTFKAYGVRKPNNGLAQCLMQHPGIPLRWRSPLHPKLMSVMTMTAMAIMSMMAMSTQECGKS